MQMMRHTSPLRIEHHPRAARNLAGQARTGAVPMAGRMAGTPPPVAKASLTSPDYVQAAGRRAIDIPEHLHATQTCCTITWQ